jgi:hypothetical protein
MDIILHNAFALRLELSTAKYQTLLVVKTFLVKDWPSFHLLTNNSRYNHFNKGADVAEWSFHSNLWKHNNASALSLTTESKPIRPRAIRSSNLLICALQSYAEVLAGVFSCLCLTF